MVPAGNLSLMLLVWFQDICIHIFGSTEWTYSFPLNFPHVELNGKYKVSCTYSITFVEPLNYKEMLQEVTWITQEINVCD
jgi:hypothetical protein